MRFIPGKIEDYDVCADIYRNTMLMERYSEGEDREEVLKDALIKSLVEDKTILAVDDSGRVAGFLMYSYKGMYGSLPYIAELGVDEALRGKGIGTALLREFIRRCVEKDAPVCFISVSSFNPGAKALYEKEGFRELTVIKDFLKEGIDECLMMKRLK